jgi:hypothetical protein
MKPLTASPLQAELMQDQENGCEEKVPAVPGDSQFGQEPQGEHWMPDQRIWQRGAIDGAT